VSKKLLYINAYVSKVERAENLINFKEKWWSLRVCNTNE